MLSSKKAFCLCLAMIFFLDSAFAPFPSSDPRAVLNPLIIPWWIYTPCRTRKAIHQVIIIFFVEKKQLNNVYFVCRLQQDPLFLPMVVQNTGPEIDLLGHDEGSSLNPILNCLILIMTVNICNSDNIQTYFYSTTDFSPQT